MAAVITATMVQKEEVKTNVISGTTERRLMRLYIEGPKAAQNDWFLLSTYIGETDGSNVVHFRSSSLESGNAMTEDVCSYDEDDWKLILTDAQTGTSFAEVLYYTE